MGLGESTGAGGVGGFAAEGTTTTMGLRTGAGAEAAAAGWIAAGGGGAISGLGAAATEGGGAADVGEADNATGPVTFPNASRIMAFSRADKSRPQPGHANATGLRTISGEASKAYFAPQSQITFMANQVLGFSRTMLVARGRAEVVSDSEGFIPPSQ